MDYVFFPPEINSARIYSGPGSGPLLAAAGSWDSVSAELGTTAETYGSVLASLTGLHWHGPASASMTAAATPYVEWLSTTARQTKQTAMQARAAAAAFDQAFAMSVPPPVIAANRVQLQALIATNFFGQNTSAIAATEAHYAEMWAQDATAMNTYATGSAAAARLASFVSPQQTTNPDGVDAQNTAAAASDPLSDLYQTVLDWSSQISNGLQNLLNLSPIPITPNGWSPLSLLDSIQLVNTAMQGTGTMAGIPASLSGNTANLFGIQANMAYLSGLASPAPALGPIGLGQLQSAAATTGFGGLGGLPHAITVSMGKGNVIGPMSVPASWTAPSTGRLAPLQPAGLTTFGADEAAGSGYPGVPGMPAGTLARGSGVMPRYGTRLTVMTRPPAGG